MKKLLGIMVLGLLLTGNAYADKSYLKDFNEFLDDSAYNLIQYGVKGIDAYDICKVEKRKSKKWFDAECQDRPGGSFGVKHKLKIKFYKDRNNIPWDGKPNFDTLLYYGFVLQDDYKGFTKIGSKGSKQSYKFLSDLRVDKDVKKEIQETGLLSYLLYENGKIVVDEKTPKNRFGILFNNRTQWTSASMGKSITSYVIGNAICEGYIDSVDSRLNDWPLIENTLYHDQKLMDLLNMAAGDQKYSKIDLTKGGKKWSKNPNRNTIKFHMEKGIFKDTKNKKGKSIYNYSNIVSNLLINYVSFKSGENFQNLLDKIFISKAKVKNPVAFLVMNKGSVQKKYKVTENDGPIRYSFIATRYDYLRIAKAMLDDWQNDTCVGKYLKTIYKNEIPKKNEYSSDNGAFFYSKSYAGQFHTNYPGLKDRAIMGMDGASGQSIIIDFEKSKIVVLNAIHLDYNWKKIAISKF
jgi:hypothetical protein|tara:strand:+ start:49 stop:1437 length:1389 start_codon:yes stop_codon:yes gene_type:complete